LILKTPECKIKILDLGGISVELGQKIKEARKAKGMTQQELGDVVGLQKSAIAKYESGRVVNIKRSTLQKIAGALNIRPSELIFDETPQGSADFHVRIITDFELMDALKDYYKLSSDNQKMVRDLIYNLKKNDN
jgi:transcriptional regulator with XRE-family HTH domain